MTKLDFILAQFHKARNKKYESYVVNRIFNLLDDLSIKFITQQYVKRPGGYALLDLYFPQLNLYLEVDEGGHKKTITSDELRGKDIANVIDLTERRIKVYDVTLEEINLQITTFVSYIKCQKINSINKGTFKEWDIETEMNPDHYIKLGYIDLNDDVSFRVQNDVFKCFGKDYEKPLWICSIKHPTLTNTTIWCPKFFEHKDWSNELSDDNLTIQTLNKNDTRDFLTKYTEHPSNEDRIVFGHILSPLGFKSYKFLGVYKFDLDESIINGAWTYVRDSTKINLEI